MKMGRCYAQGVDDALRAGATNLEIFRLSRHLRNWAFSPQRHS